METIQNTTINYRNTRVTLSVMKTGRYYISNGCEPLGFADNYVTAYRIYESKVKAFKAKRTRELNKLKKIVIRDFPSIDEEALGESLIKEFHMTAEEAADFYNSCKLKAN